MLCIIEKRQAFESLVSLWEWVLLINYWSLITLTLSLYPSLPLSRISACGQERLVGKAYLFVLNFESPTMALITNQWPHGLKKEKGKRKKKKKMLTRIWASRPTYYMRKGRPFIPASATRKKGGQMAKHNSPGIYFRSSTKILGVSCNNATEIGWKWEFFWVTLLKVGRYGIWTICIMS